MDAKFPIGHFKINGGITEAQRMEWMNDIEQLPSLLIAAVKGLTRSSWTLLIVMEDGRLGRWFIISQTAI